MKKKVIAATAILITTSMSLAVLLGIKLNISNTASVVEVVTEQVNDNVDIEYNNILNTVQEQTGKIPDWLK